MTDIPANYLALYQAAGQRYGIDPWILAAIGSIETDHGRSTAPGVHSGVNSYGCCAGPMQFSVLGAGSTWDTYGVDGDHDGRKDVYEVMDFSETLKEMVLRGESAIALRKTVAVLRSDARVLLGELIRPHRAVK